MVVELVVRDLKLLKPIKTILENEGLFVKPIYSEGEDKIIRTRISDSNHQLLESLGTGVLVREIDGPVIQSHTKNDITEFTRHFFEGKLENATVIKLLEVLPVKYTVFPPLLLFNYSKQRSFLNELWQQTVPSELMDQFYQAMLSAPFLANKKVSHIATNMPIIESDVMRRPFNIVPLYGFKNSIPNEDKIWDSPSAQDFQDALWCQVNQNGIEQVWAPQFTMFSRGNIKEKKRILDTFTDIEGNDVVDMYSGIGYFTLSYLTRNARTVFAFELNPWSVEGLKRGLKANRIDQNRCHIFNESNANCLTRIKEYASIHGPPHIRHINLGLLPSSRDGWPLAVQLYRYQLQFSTDRITIHIHENVHIDHIRENSFIANTVAQLQEIDSELTYTPTHLEQIKTFAPDVWHICLDVDIDH